MKIFLNLITTLATVYAISFIVSFALASAGLPNFVSMITSFCIGFFGSRVIYEWLSKSDTQSEEDSESGL